MIFQRFLRENDSSRNDGGGKNGVIYMGIISGPNKADDTCGKTTGTMERGSTVLMSVACQHEEKPRKPKILERSIC
jgi:hypothetical protein